MKRNRLWVSFFSLVLLVLLVLVAAGNSKNTDKMPFYFDKEPFINPRLIADMTTWLSDNGDQVVAIDLNGAQHCNRYFAETKTQATKGENLYVYFEEDGESFGYQLIGKTDSGIYVLETSSGGEGSGVFKELMLVVIERDKNLCYRKEQAVVELNNDRLVIKKLGIISLGDRYSGLLKVKGDSLYVGRDENGRTGIFQNDLLIKIKDVR